MNHSQNARALGTESAASKAEYRKVLKTTLKSRETHEGREASESQLAQALEIGLSRYPGVWLSYRGFSTEARLPLSLNGLAAESSAVQFAYPVVQSAADSMSFYRTASGSGRFEVGPFGIETPDISNDWRLVSADSDVAVVGALVPGLGFDRSGGRLGRGRGYYDRFLAETDTKRKAHGLRPLLKIGIGFHEQVVEELPCEMHDVKLDAVLTDREWITPVKGVGNE